MGKVKVPSSKRSTNPTQLLRYDPIKVEVYSQMGLLSDQVSQRLDLGLSNSQSPVSSRSIANIIRANTLTVFNGVIVVALVLVLWTGNLEDALFGIPAVINVFLGIVQELRSKFLLDRLSLVYKNEVLVKRDGRIVVDVLLLTTTDLVVDESTISGESELLPKFEGEELLSGCLVLSGSATARAIRVGAESFSGHLDREAKRYQVVNSEIRRAINKVIFVITCLLLPLSVVVALGQISAFGGLQVIIESAQTNQLLLSVVGSIVPMVPQGLVLLASISFAIAAIRLARHNVLAQELPAVETLARVDVVCLDKTGTLTTGAMHRHSLDIVGVGKPSELNIEDVLGFFANSPDANKTARALGNGQNQGSSLSVVREVSFNSVQGYSAKTFLSNPDEAETWVIGAPETVIDPNSYPEQLEHARWMALKGFRVVAVATGDLVNEDKPLDTSVLVPRAIISLSEEIRADAKSTVDYLIKQGVSIRIISGDHPLTVAGIASQIGLEDIVKPDVTNVVDGSALPENLEELSEILEDKYVFGRIKPDQKQLMIQALQMKKHVVAMTGDGVNDVLALKQADLGIAMGNGSAATKAVAKLVLTNNEFSCVPNVISEGRKIIANMERVAALFLTKTVWAMLIAVVFGLLSIKLAYTPKQITVMDLYIIGIPSFALAVLPNQQLYKPGFLKRTLLFSLPAGLIIGLAVIIQRQLLDQAITTASLQTNHILLLSIAGVWIVNILSRPINALRLAIVSLCFVIFVTIFTAPWLSSLVGLTRLDLQECSITFAIGIASCIALELLGRFTLLRRSAPGWSKF